MIVAILVCPPTGAGEDGTTSAISGRDFYPRGNLSDNRPENSSGATGLIISLTQSLSLDLRLVQSAQVRLYPEKNGLSTPPIPIPKAPGSDLRYSRLGVGLSFGF